MNGPSLLNYCCRRYSWHFIRNKVRLLCSSQNSGQMSSIYQYSEKLNNRNPHNLKAFGIERKPKGWQFQFPSVEYYLKCVFTRHSSFTSGSVVTYQGDVVVEASTKEQSISEHLHSVSDVSAAWNVGRILARRCLQAGIHAVHFDLIEQPLTSERLQMFHQAMLDGGVELSEPEEMSPQLGYGIDYDELSSRDKLSLYPSLLDELKTSEDVTDYTDYPLTMRPKKGQEREKRYQALGKIRRGWRWDIHYQRIVPSEKDDNPFYDC